MDVGINCMPVLPGITDRPRDLADLVRAAADAGASTVAACALRLQPTARDRYLPWLATEFPALAARYRATYARGHYAGDAYREGLHAYMARLCERHGLRVREYSRDGAARARTSMRDRPAGAQLSLDL